MYASESTGEFIPEPPGSGLMFMNEAGFFGPINSLQIFAQLVPQVGDTTMLDCSDPNTLLLQMGAFAQIYTGRVRHMDFSEVLFWFSNVFSNS